jgi:hypothetical protein
MWLNARGGVCSLMEHMRMVISVLGTFSPWKPAGILCVEIGIRNSLRYHVVDDAGHCVYAETVIRAVHFVVGVSIFRWRGPAASTQAVATCRSPLWLISIAVYALLAVLFGSLLHR